MKISPSVLDGIVAIPSGFVDEAGYLPDSFAVWYVDPDHLAIVPG